jgi:hypothetical protein
MTSKPIEHYLALKELAEEHPVLRQIHASRLKIHDDRQGLTSEERRAQTRAAADQFMKSGIDVKSTNQPS